MQQPLPQTACIFGVGHSQNSLYIWFIKQKCYEGNKCVFGNTILLFSKWYQFPHNTKSQINISYTQLPRLCDSENLEMKLTPKYA